MQTKLQETDNLPISPISFYFPDRLKDIINFVCRNPRLEEIRVRANQPLQIVTSLAEHLLRDTKQEYIIVTAQECANMLSSFCAQSIYACEEELRQGFVTLPGGVRVGVCGKTVLENNVIKRFSVVNAFNIRVAKQCLGCADKIMPYIIEQTSLLSQVVSTLIVSSPAIGKTTLLRDIARQLSNIKAFPPMKVCLIDERSELAGCKNGLPTYDVGQRTDVMDDCPKAQGIQMAIRALSPTVLIMDELGKKQDVEAVFEACNCGVAIIASAHAGSIEDVVMRPTLYELINSNCIKQVALLRMKDGERIFEMYDSRTLEVMT